MATASSFLSEDQFLCSICLDVFTEPVSIPCGHNYCKACITRHWEGREQCQCPLCNEKFDKGLKLRVNTGFREVVENYKEHQALADKNPPVEPGQVQCDCCLNNKFKASETCLVCLTSYCETHLEPHLRVAALKRHKLTNPVHNLEDQICKKHNRMLELFCRNDQTCACALCTEHSAHDTIPLEGAWVDKRAQKGKKRAEVKEMKHKRGKRAQKTKMAAQTRRKGKAPLVWWIPHQFNRYNYVPGDLSKGSFYHEVQAEGSLGLRVDRESMRGMRTFIPTNENWLIRLGSDTYCNSPDIHIHYLPIREPERVLVLVDYDNRSVSFFDTDTMIHAFTFNDFKFNEIIYIFYRPGPTEDDSWAQRLRMTVHKIKAWSQLPDTILFRCMAIFLFALAFCIVLREKFEGGSISRNGT
ncbi:uncharacterized protein LOC119497658 isoform X2 [Sebastes umbrosus]|uniref:uncharacterized protein LOC119497658 isoform X2 n=1 Tax=Sebastes umbrosus TaxID=72105 RepID=UPI0018A05EB5|nr:uncharacterized protein LOC119497658 isoform X2 [Sebastes umbrosus]